MTTFQVIALLFAIFMMYWVFSTYKRKGIRKTETVLWMGIWVGFAVVAVFPNLLMGIAGALKFARVFDLLVVIAFMVLSAMVFYMYLRMKKNEKKLEDLVREMAIEKKVRNDKN